MNNRESGGFSPESEKNHEFQQKLETAISQFNEGMERYREIYGDEAQEYIEKVISKLKQGDKESIESALHILEKMSSEPFEESHLSKYGKFDKHPLAVIEELRTARDTILSLLVETESTAEFNDEKLQKYLKDNQAELEIFFPRVDHMYKEDYEELYKSVMRQLETIDFEKSAIDREELKKIRDYIAQRMLESKSMPITEKPKRGM